MDKKVIYRTAELSKPEQGGEVTILFAWRAQLNDWVSIVKYYNGGFINKQVKSKTLGRKLWLAYIEAGFEHVSDGTLNRLGSRGSRA
jgi:hypothetical protein